MQTIRPETLHANCSYKEAGALGELGQRCVRGSGNVNCQTRHG